MTSSFDLVVIGAGPAACAAVSVLSGYAGKFALLTGDTPTAMQVRHPKIASVGLERGKAGAFTDHARMADGPAELFSSAEAGGLANFWGQQVWRYASADPWPQDGEMRSWQSYINACVKIEEGFRISGGRTLAKVQGGGVSLDVMEPRLLVGTDIEPDAELNAVPNAIVARLSRLRHSVVIPARVKALAPGPQGVRIILEDGSMLRAARVLLAAGVVGTAGILTRSSGDFAEVRLRDHAPYLLKTVFLGRALGPWLSRTGPSFNALSLMMKSQDRCDIFASVYDLSRAATSLVSAGFGLGARLPGRRARLFPSFIRPVQLWTRQSQAIATCSLRHGTVSVMHAPQPDADPALRSFRAFLRSHGVPATVSTTAFGHGFHHHHLELLDRSGTAHAVDDVLADQFANRVRCIDASVMQEIGCLPHTLTMMVGAAARTAAFCD